MPFHRKRWDAQPTDPCDVLLASDGRQDFTNGAVARAAALADEGSVGVVTIAKIYGSQFGLPNPGLLPTKNEMRDRQAWVGSAIQQLQRRGVRADGQVAATRHTTRKLAGVARARGARIVVIDETTSSGIRRRIEGDVGEELRRKLRKDGIAVEIVARGTPARDAEVPRSAAG